MSIKKIIKGVSPVLLLIVLSGCVQRSASGEPTGIIWDVLGHPMEQFIYWFAALFNNEVGSYGLGIIIVTFIIRLIITPLNIQMSNANTINQERMAYIKPQMDVLNKRMKEAKTPQEQMIARQDLMALQQAAGIKLFSAKGCLPLFIQMPLFSAMCFATISSPQILNDVFMGIPLNKPSMILMVLSSAFYLIQGLISQIGLTPEQKQTTRTMIFMAPLMNVLFAMAAPAGAVLYWTVGGIMSCFISLYTVYVSKPRLKKQVAEEMANKTFNIPTRKDVTHTVTPQQSLNHTTERRNAGKQQKR